MNAVCASMVQSASLESHHHCDEDGVSLYPHYHALYSNPRLYPSNRRYCYLFGDYKYKHETDKVLKRKYGSGAGEPMLAEFALRPIWELYENISLAASVAGLKSEIFTDGRYDHLVTTALNNNGNNKNEGSKITAKTQGMDQVLSSIQIGRQHLSY